MFKVILTVLISVFVTLSVLMVLYWRDADYEPTSFDLMVFFGLIPLGISLLILTPYLMVKGYQKRQKKKAEQAEREEQNAKKVTIEEEVAAVVQLKLHIFSAAAQSVHGQNQSLLQTMSSAAGPQLDPELVDGLGNHILSYRMLDLDDQLRNDGSNEQHFSSVRQGRISMLIQEQLQQHIHTLQRVAEHLKQSALFYDTQLAYAYRMHPAWKNPQLSNALDEDEALEVVQQVTRLDCLNIQIVLSQSLKHVWDEALSTGEIQDFFFALGVLDQQIHCSYRYSTEQQSYSEWITTLQQIEQQQQQVWLVIVADSEIDQDSVDEKIARSAAYVPAEFASSCCIASPDIQIEHVETLKTLHLVLNESSLSNCLEALKLADLQQYQQQQPFVVVLEDPAEIQGFKKLAQNFSKTPIETHHYLYSRSSVGHTQYLSKYFGFMLAMQANETTHSMVYSTQYPLTQVIISPVIMQEVS